MQALAPKSRLLDLDGSLSGFDHCALVSSVRAEKSPLKPLRINPDESRAKLQFC
jgi:hypothetical protein